MEWMNRNGLTGEVVKWIEKLPAEKLTAPPAAVAVADAYTNAKNWMRLKRWTRKGMWGESDYLRLAYQAIAAASITTEEARTQNSMHFGAPQNNRNQPDRARTCPRASGLEMESGERIRATLAACRGRCAHETRGTRRASSALSGGQ